MAAGNAVILQGGGPTAVINRTMVAAVRRFRAADPAMKIYGASFSLEGLLRRQFMPLHDTQLYPDEKLDAIARTPCSALGSSRTKPRPMDLPRIVDIFKDFNIRYLVYIGGNGTAGNALTIMSYANANGYDVFGGHAPKTIDNDINGGTYVCPGFGSAALYVATAVMGLDVENRSTPGVAITVTMGHDSGFLAMSSCLARRRDDDGPHLVYVPEVKFDLAKFKRSVLRVYEKLGRAHVVVAEGIADKLGVTINALGEHLSNLLRDAAHSHPTLRIRSNTLGYQQRSFPLVSAVDARLAYEAGSAAADMALVEQAGSIAIKQDEGAVPGADFPHRMEVVDLAVVAKGKRKLAPEHYLEGNRGATPEFLEYAGQFTGELPRFEHLY